MKAFVIAIMATAVAAGSSQDRLDAARQLYEAAAFEEALTALAKVSEAGNLTPDDQRELEEYRMFSLFALGRTGEAESEAESMVRRNPLARLKTSDVPPRIRAMFDGVRVRVLPQLIRERYRVGRTAVESKDFLAAEAALTAAQQLIEDAEKTKLSDAGLADLRVLVDGFLLLSRSQTASADQAAKAIETPAPAPPPEPAVRAPEKSIYSIEDADVVPPVVVRQTVPPVPAALHGQVMQQRRPLIVSLTIDPTGRVRRADVASPVNPVYDRLVTDAALSWRYKPAMKGSVPVTYQKALAIAIQ